MKMVESICPCRSQEVQLQPGLHTFVLIKKEETAFLWICVRNDYYSDITHSFSRHQSDNFRLCFWRRKYPICLLASRRRVFCWWFSVDFDVFEADYSHLKFLQLFSLQRCFCKEIVWLIWIHCKHEILLQMLYYFEPHWNCAMPAWCVNLDTLLHSMNPWKTISLICEWSFLRSISQFSLQQCYHDDYMRVRGCCTLDTAW